MSTTVYFVRHAQSPWIPNRQTERPLSAAGERNARYLADRLIDCEIDAVVSSHYRRALQTAEPIATDHGLDIDIEEGFCERTLTDGPTENIGETFENAVAAVWNDPSFAWPNGESNDDARRRGVRALEAVLDHHADETVVIATHGQLLTVMLGHYDDRFDERFWREDLTTPDLYEATFENGALTGIERRFDGPRD